MPHAEGYRRLLIAIRDDAYNFDEADRLGVVEYETVPTGQEQ